MNEPDEEHAEAPLHREVTRWVVATLGGGLAVAAFVLLLLSGPPGSRPRPFLSALGGVAFTAPLEAAAALVRRCGWGWSPLLLLAPPVCLALLVGTWTWVDAVADGGPGRAVELAATRLGELRFAEDERWALAAVAAALLPLAYARAAQARLRVTCAVTAAVPLALFAWTSVFGEGPHDDPRRPSVTVFPLFGPGEAVLLGLLLLAQAIGLHQGDRLLRWAVSRSDSPHRPRDASDNQPGESTHIRPAGPHPPLTPKDF